MQGIPMYEHRWSYWPDWVWVFWLVRYPPKETNDSDDQKTPGLVCGIWASILMV